MFAVRLYYRDETNHCRLYSLSIKIAVNSINNVKSKLNGNVNESA